MRTGKMRPYLIYILLAFVYFIITFLVEIILHDLDRNKKLIAEYKLERTAAGAFESLLEGTFVNEALLDSSIFGFGIYRLNGRKYVIFGTAPETLPVNLPGPRGSRIEYDRQAETHILIRPIGRGPEMPRHMMDRELQAPGFLFIEKYIPRYWYEKELFGIFILLVPFILLVIPLSIGYLFRKNEKYKVKLSSQEELVRLGEISRTLNHEIKNPLSAIKLQTAYLKKVLPSAQQEELGIIDEEINRLKSLTTHISDFVRDPGGFPEKIHLLSFITNLIRRFDHSFEIHGETENDLIFFDKERLRSVMENIITNAVESYESYLLVERSPVKIFIKEDFDSKIVIFKDNGTGLPGASNEEFFEPGKTGKSLGTGIGLAIAKRFVEARGGSITLSSGKEGGTEVKIVFSKDIK